MRFVGNIFEDVYGAATDVVDAAFSLPGLAQIADVVTSALDGPVKDFARTAVGRVVLTAVASSLSGGLAPLVGPQLMTVAWALPGMAAGDDFVTAWTQEVARRTEQTAEALGGDPTVVKLFGDQIEKAALFLKESGVDPARIDFRALATQLGIRQDAAAAALDAAKHGLSDLLRRFNPITGSVSGAGADVNALRQYATWSQDRRASNAARAAVTKGPSFLDDNPELRRAAVAPAPAPAPTYRGGLPTVEKAAGDHLFVGVVAAAVACGLGYLVWRSR